MTASFLLFQTASSTPVHSVSLPSLPAIPASTVFPFAFSVMMNSGSPLVSLHHSPGALGPQLPSPFLLLFAGLP